MRNTWLFGLFFLIWSCQTSKQDLVYDPVTLMEERTLDTLVVSAPAPPSAEGVEAPAPILERPRYNPSARRVNDLLHTSLQISFDWEKEQVRGKASLSFKPYFYPTDQVTLDAKNFNIHAVRLLPDNQELKYAYDGRQITIELDRTYSREETYAIEIDYTASPTATGGSQAITSDKGLFFINSSGEDPDKPMQIWTQGETEHNSRWFPSIDKPNERCTQEIHLTVEDRFTTLSNGVMISSTNNPDGTRTDHWKLNQPHAPYLFMVAVGEFAVVRETWEDIPVEYYVEPGFEEDAQAIFPHTPEMLSFFSDKLGLTYPWPKYAQIVVRDYVSGAMENTTAVVFGEFMQRPARELIDDRFNEKIVAHELIHHWFGDLVTCESWANLPLNEGFANYGEYLWLEHKYGRDEAQYHLLGEWNNYLATSDYRLHPLIHFGYVDKENMFDQHSYEKGGAVLHMLRHYVGEDAFFNALQKYLKKYQYDAAEAHELRLVFEEVTGEDLNWFFNQWFFAQGHPELDIDYEYIDSSQTLALTIEQTQNPDYNLPVFKLPTQVAIYTEDGEADIHPITVDQRRQTFLFEMPAAPRLVNFDPDKTLLARIQEEKTDEEFAFQYYHASNYLDRYASVIQMAESDHPKAAEVLLSALEDNHWTIRNFALQQLEVDSLTPQAAPTLRKLAEKDPHSIVRMNALDLLTELKDSESVPIAQRILKTEQAYPVLTAALFLLMELDLPEALKAAESFQGEENLYLLEAVELIFAESGDPKYLPFFEENFTRFEGFSALAFADSYQSLLLKSDAETIMAGAKKMEALALDQSVSYWLRLAGTKTLSDISAELSDRIGKSTDSDRKKTLQQYAAQVQSMIRQIKEQEKDEKLLEIYKQLRP